MPDRIDEMKRLMTNAEQALDKVESYASIIHCHERIKGKLRKPERIFTYFKKPNSVYLRWQRGPYNGLQASFVPHRDGPNSFQARETGLKGLAGTITFPHTSPIIEKAYPHHFRTNETSVQHLMQLSIDIQRKAEELGTYSVTDISELTDPILRIQATKVMSDLSKNRGDGLRWLKTEFYFDHVTKLPLHFKLYDFDGHLSGDYAFTEFKTNVPLTDADFALKKR